MFEFSDAKRVCREDLQSRRSSRSPSPLDTATATYAANALRNIFSSVGTYTPPPPPHLRPANPTADLEHIQDEEEEQEFEFRLFREPLVCAEKGASGHDRVGSGQTDAPKQVNGMDAGIRKFRIRLRSQSPTVNDGEGGFVVPFRGWEYYFSNPEWARRKMAGEGIGALSAESDTRQKQGFVDAAVSGETILEGANSGVWPGCHLPWRVIHLKTVPSQNKQNEPTDSPHTTAVTLLDPLAVSKAPKSRKKPGKKRRIILRQRLAAAKTAEADEREKRTRRNREKKIKRRQKERERKATLRESKDEQGEIAGSEAANSDFK
ncbi:conserved hypothetical protein [Histoplasma capsulatum G186AR]|uniref:Uncharacterized protein n=1 Tax=Ajellomyces capsulatus (strain G186AR / H82 / ATCC MYA-2454 / RMSCC 2432) TaxID=447093 RepID=C0NS73_AJECG|nr:uncharacterized protein HCBG_06003 [Histoplasma capsulatum G186AR]EEH05739.1 conserved hypothetical protein [Histoplasma capsulatum G186AR]